MPDISYVILGVGALMSVGLFIWAGRPEYGQIGFRARVAGGWYSARDKTNHHLDNELLRELLHAAGLNMSAPSYQYFRIVLTSVLALVGIWGVLTGHGLLLGSPIFVWFLLGYQKPFPMYYGLKQLQKYAGSERNGKLYLLYRLMLQEIVAFQEQPIGVFEMLMRQHDRVRGIDVYLKRLLDRWVDNPIEALERFGEEMGTEQAKIFAHMLAQIEVAGIDVALDLFEANQDAFRTDRLTAFSASLSTRALFATALTLTGFGASSFDLQVLMQNYSAAMMQMIGK